MNKYLVTIATELDGHAGSIGIYMQTEKALTRPTMLFQIIKLFEIEDYIVDFQESSASLAKADPSIYYGDIITKSKEGNIISTDTISVQVAQLPKRLIKDKLYIIESRTG